MDFGIRQVYLNPNLSFFEGVFDFGQVSFILLNLRLCVHHRVVIRIKRKKNIYNYLTHRKYSIVLFPLPF